MEVGTVALKFAIKYQNYCSKIVLCSGVARYEKELPKSPLAKFIETMPFFPGKNTYMRFIKLVRNAKSLSQDELKMINIPTLIVNGSNDIVPIDEAKYIANAIPNSQLLILESATHQSYMTKINWYDNLLNFIEV